MMAWMKFINSKMCSMKICLSFVVVFIVLSDFVISSNGKDEENKGVTESHKRVGELIPSANHKPLKHVDIYNSTRIPRRKNRENSKQGNKKRRTRIREGDFRNVGDDQFPSTDQESYKHPRRHHRRGGGSSTHGLGINSSGNARGQRRKMNKNALRLLSNEDGGAFPPLNNIAPRASFTVNATCGLNGREEFCKLVDAHPHKTWATQCGICDINSLDVDKKHPIEAVLDSSSGWWQSPTLQYGSQYEYVTITMDLKQIYEIFFIMLRSAVSPRPASWILEHSLDNRTYEAWQYFGTSDSDCRRRYNLSGETGKYMFQRDDEVICTTQFSKAMPLENGDIHVSLVNNRPGIMTQSHDLMDFISARYIRIRFQGMHSTANAANSIGWILDAQSLKKRSFYSLKSIRVSGRLVCSGHANQTYEIEDEDGNVTYHCLCIHNTCGEDCGKCCPLYNQQPYRRGGGKSKNICERCECFGHAKTCAFDPEIAAQQLSVNTKGMRHGGGICLNCTDNTMGVNCEKCKPGYFRFQGASPEQSCQKCNCDVFGSVDDVCNPIGGECICREGFAGYHCELCAFGYKGPECTKCSCDPRGIQPGGECNELCQCKKYVEGEHCDECTHGYFGLEEYKPEGCTKCFCSGVGLSCRSARIEMRSFETLDDWQVTDITMSEFAHPFYDNNTHSLLIGIDELENVEDVYWLAPPKYGGNRLTSYGSVIVITLSWVIIRGDTSGKPILGPNIIFIGRNGMKIALGDDIFTTSGATFEIRLMEDGWYHIPKDVTDITKRTSRMNYRGEPVTRAQFMSVLLDVDSIMIRAVFHKDQVECMLERVTIYTGGYDMFGNVITAIEKCNCPPGYEGLSCERCSFGYMRIYENTSTNEIVGKCYPCSCNGHAESCNLETGECGECVHNTFGERCERCTVGFFGNPMHGTPTDCQRCACPLLVESNNFSPGCQLKKLTLDVDRADYLDFDESESFMEYVCTQCPIGYTGDHCEFCDDGFYGDPMVIGSKCLPCPCNGEPCDPETGRCISCQPNTEGWKCERCKTGYYGNATIGCQLCDCNEIGSLEQICDSENGQCPCKVRFTGQSCDECDHGFTKLDNDCVPCQCNVSGSIDSICDPQNGQCKCKEGVGGLKCDTCTENFFNMTTGGCEECHCSPQGSLGKHCDHRTGQCYCNTNVIGRRCEKCRPGCWNLTTGIGCADCQCDTMGSNSRECNPWNGQCDCKMGVTGRRCTECQEGFFGYSPDGCKPCEECSSPNFVCDPDTGRCICPLYSKGPDCQKCYPNTWGWVPKLGCRVCDCDSIGSIGQSCNPNTGQCICREGYSGRRCDTCAIGYLGFPNCSRCNCNPHGSIVREDGLIECDSRGKCPCKSLVIGDKCDTCRPNTFALSKSNPDGCTRCFCFSRSQECKQSDLSWGHVKTSKPRSLLIEYVSPNQFTSQEFSFVRVHFTDHDSTESREVLVRNDVTLIPETRGNVSIGAFGDFHYPLYFQMPSQFHGDKTTSYGGYLTFDITTEGGTNLLESRVLQRFPLVQIHSHHKLVINYYELQNHILDEVHLNQSFKVHLHESRWKYHINGPYINRAAIMGALQNIKHIFIRSSVWADFRQVVIHNVHMDLGIHVAGSTNMIAYGVEQCHCPEKYDGFSCQNPGRGYYRWRNRTDSDRVALEDLIGRAVKCECNGRSEDCDRETGACTNCRDNTGGDSCERCADGHYGDPLFNGCSPCPCPETNRNYARGCSVHDRQVSCLCKPGYTGPLCDTCATGYYGNPEDIDGQCQPCNCNSDGVLINGCDKTTGQCYCKPGITGKQCDRCDTRRYVLDNKKCRLCDNCTLMLLDSMDELTSSFEYDVKHIDMNGIPPPWTSVEEFEIQMQTLKEKLEMYIEAKQILLGYDQNSIERLMAHSENNKVQNRRLHALAEKHTIEATLLTAEADNIFDEAEEILKQIKQTIYDLEKFNSQDHHTEIANALDQAKYTLELIRGHTYDAEEFKKTWKCAWDNFYFYGNASDKVYDQLGELELLNIAFNNWRQRHASLMMLVTKTFENLNATEDINEHNRNQINRLVDDLNYVHNEKEKVNEFLNNSLLTETDTLLGIVDNNLNRIRTDTETIKSLSNMTDEALNQSAKTLRSIEKHWIPKSRKHAFELQRQAEEYSKLSKTTIDGAEIALRASSAHKNITEAIREAHLAAIEAKESAETARIKLNPSDEPSVIEKARVSSERSRQLERTAMREMQKASDLRGDLQEGDRKIEAVKSVIWTAGVKANNISSTIEDIDLGNTDAFRESHTIAASISEQMRTEMRRTDDLKADLYKLRQKLINLEPDWDVKFSLAEENISQTLRNIQNANKSLNNYEFQAMKSQAVFDEWNGSMTKQLQDLKDKIAKARHAAKGIKVSLESNDRKCVRSYAPASFGLSTSNSIKISIALNNTNGNSPLIYVEGENRKFIALEMVKRKIRLIWNLGGKIGVLTHPLEIQTRNPKYDDAWYHIEANRTLNLGRLLVRRMTNNGYLESSTLSSGATDLEHTTLYRTLSNRVWLGGVPKQFNVKELQAKSGLNVIIQHAYVDGYGIGLWNFIESEGTCGGAMLGAQETSATSNARHFNGQGYAELRKTRPRSYRKNVFALQITFKTLDENALLFLAVDDKNNRSLSVTLHGGRVVFRIDYGDDSKLEINTTKKYNTGTWVSVEAAREFTPKRGTENGSLRVNNDERLMGAPSAPVTSAMLPDFTKALYYLAGVPPGFRSGITKAPGADHPFMGCMMDVQINGETYDALESTSFFGVEQSCKEFITTAGFYGNGYLELPSRTLRKRANLAFVFRTVQSECLILLSVYPPSVSEDYDHKDIRGNYSISVIDGKIVVYMDTGREAIKIRSNVTINDGEFHILNVVKTFNRVDLMIDDEFQASKNITGLPIQIFMPKDAGGLYLGGAPQFYEYEKFDLVPTLVPMEGAIRDVVFNNKTISFSSVLNFTNVHIGRTGPQMGSYNGILDVLMKTEPIGKSFTALSEGCQRVGSYSYEPYAFKFGDGPFSHSQLNIRNLWQNNFNIKFDFRTFYPTGAIIIAPGTKEKPKHYVALLLKDGRLQFTVRGRRKEEVILPTQLNDGQWHHVTITCQDRKVSVSVEIGNSGKVDLAQMKIPKRVSSSNVIYVGGMPENTYILPTEVIVKLEAFKGCLRKMSINNSTQELAKPGKHHNVGQCFPRVEMGSYFPGDAYAIYKKNFQVGKYLEFDLEFRTSELNGVLLSVSEPVGFPALSMELHDGNIIFSCDLGDGNPFRVESVLTSKHALCDNKWHNVSALYDYEHISLRIDNNPGMEKFTQTKGITKMHTKSPLYIGGLPDIAPSGTLLSRENFKGCIRNVSIRNERRDWTDMDVLHNVLLSECLAVN